MTSDRIRAIREGRVSDGWQLPEGAVPIETIDRCTSDQCPANLKLPNDAVRLDLLPGGAIKQTLALDEPDEDPQPLEVSIQEWSFRDRDSGDGLLAKLLDRHAQMIDTRIRSEAKPIREGLGAAVRWIGFAIAGSTVFILVSGWLYLRTKLP
jgi:hypothetical protein